MAVSRLTAAYELPTTVIKRLTLMRGEQIPKVIQRLVVFLASEDTGKIIGQTTYIGDVVMD